MESTDLRKDNFSTIKGEKIFFDFIEVDYNDILTKDERHEYIDDIREDKLVGVVFRNVFSQDEIENILDSIAEIPKYKFMDVPYGKIFPAPFATINGTPEGIEKYYASQDEYNLLRKETSIGLLQDRVSELIENVSNSDSKSDMHDNLNNKGITRGTIRVYEPGGGGLHFHCGHYQQKVKFYECLSDDIKIRPQLSYFVVLQNSEKGGELSIYDLLWKDDMWKDNAENNEYVIDGSGKKIYVDDLKKFEIKPGQGDMLVFFGGDIWHRVENIFGSIPRMTYGGFINFSKDNENVYLWS